MFVNSEVEKVIAAFVRAAVARNAFACAAREFLLVAAVWRKKRKHSTAETEAVLAASAAEKAARAALQKATDEWLELVGTQTHRDENEDGRVIGLSPIPNSYRQLQAAERQKREYQKGQAELAELKKKQASAKRKKK